MFEMLRVLHPSSCIPLSLTDMGDDDSTRTPHWEHYGYVAYGQPVPYSYMSDCGQVHPHLQATWHAPWLPTCNNLRPMHDIMYQGNAAPPASHSSMPYTHIDSHLPRIPPQHAASQTQHSAAPTSHPDKDRPVKRPRWSNGNQSPYNAVYGTAQQVLQQSRSMAAAREPHAAPKPIKQMLASHSTSVGEL